MSSCPHPAVLQSLGGAPAQSQHISACEWAKMLRGKLMGLMDATIQCPEQPIKIEDEEWDHAGFIKMILECIDWTYSLCNKEETVYMGISHSRPCSRGVGDCCPGERYYD